MNQALHFIRKNWLPLIMVILPSGLFLEPLPLTATLYYSLLGILAILSIIKHQETDKTAIVFLMVCGVSILLGNPSPILNHGVV